MVLLVQYLKSVIKSVSAFSNNLSFLLPSFLTCDISSPKCSNLSNSYLLSFSCVFRISTLKLSKNESLFWLYVCNCCHVNSLECSTTFFMSDLALSISFRIVLYCFSKFLWFLPISSNISFLVVSFFSLMVLSCIVIFNANFSFFWRIDFMLESISSVLTASCLFFTDTCSRLSWHTCNRNWISWMIPLNLVFISSVLLSRFVNYFSNLFVISSLNLCIPSKSPLISLISALNRACLALTLLVLSNRSTNVFNCSKFQNLGSDLLYS